MLIVFERLSTVNVIVEYKGSCRWIISNFSRSSTSFTDVPSIGDSVILAIDPADDMGIGLPIAMKSLFLIEVFGPEYGAIIFAS